MKTPKVDTPKPKLKFNTPKSGLVRKSLGQSSTKSFKKFSVKGKEQALSLVKGNEDIVEIKTKTPQKTRMSLPANAFNNTRTSPASLESSKTPKKSVADKLVTPEVTKGKSGKKNSLANVTLKKLKSPVEQKSNNVEKTPLNKPTSQNVESNSSPIKQNIVEKKEKVQFNLDDSLVNKTPNGDKQIKKISLAKSKVNSPEVELGLQLEQALSPKQDKGRKKKMLSAKLALQGKVNVNKLDSEKSESNANTLTKKKKRTRTHKKKQNITADKKHPSILKHTNALNAVNALLKIYEPKKNDLLDSEQYIYLQFNLLKQSLHSRGVYKVVLPHRVLPDTPEIGLIIADLKGKRNEPEEAIDHCKEILDRNGITEVTEIIPVRKLKQEYSQHEENMKLANKLDVILCDGRILRVGRVEKRFARHKKCICPINLNSTILKEKFEKSLRKVAIFSSGKGTSFSVKCGRIGMQATEIADNIVTIGEFFANNKTLIGEANNFSTISVKTALSDAFPVYASTVSPNEVQKPKGKEMKVEEIVEDEITTVEGATVVVYPSGNVKVKKRKNEENNGVENQTKKFKTTTMKDSNETNEELTDDDNADSYSTGHESSDIEDYLQDSDIENGSEGEVSENEGDTENESEIDDQSQSGEEEDEDEQSLDEEEIEAAEKAYLQELRKQQDELGSLKKGKPGVKAKEGVKKDRVTPQMKNAAVKGKLGGKGKQVVQELKKNAMKEQQVINQGKKSDKQNNVKGNQNNLQKKKKENSPQQSPQQNKGKPLGQRNGPNNAQQNKGKQNQKSPNNAQQNKGKQNQKSPNNAQQNEGKQNQKKLNNVQQNKGKQNQKSPNNVQQNKGKQNQESPNNVQQNKGKQNQKSPNNRIKNTFQKGKPGSQTKNNFNKGPAGKNKQ